MCLLYVYAYIFNKGYIDFYSFNYDFTTLESLNETLYNNVKGYFKYF